MSARAVEALRANESKPAMSSLFIQSDVSAGIITVESPAPLENPQVTDVQGNVVDCPRLDSRRAGSVWRTRFDASALTPWSPAKPCLFYFSDGAVRERFGFCELATFGNTDVRLNGERIYLRGYIRGIVAHEHPNMTGGTERDAAVKNISQARKFGFNLVRFHSTIPSEAFVEAADELGLLIHMEIGFAYEVDEKGNKRELAMDNAAWRETLLRYRNHPSVAIFCIGNEMHNSGHQPVVHELYRQGRELAPNKLIMDNSGWGEYDRPTADIFSQHIAYYYPYKSHAGMFRSHDCWRMNGSTYDIPLEEAGTTPHGTEVAVRRDPVPVRPVIAHEAIHYIDIPDYQALADKFDAFCRGVSSDYLKINEITRPKFMSGLPALIAAKGLAAKMPDYIAGSQHFKKLAIKRYLETLRQSPLCGYEMLQFADCLKYENRNGIVDCFDDDRFIKAEWMRQFNGDLVVLAEFADEVLYEDQPLEVALSISDFLPQPRVKGTLEVVWDGERVWEGQAVVLAGGLQRIADLALKAPATGRARRVTLSVRFTSPEVTATNSWDFFLYPRVAIPVEPAFCNRLDDALLARLEAGETVILNYHRDRPDNQYYWPGALERFKPCIWDRGSNLGGFVSAACLQEALGSGRYFDENLQPLLEGAYKINLDDFPVPVAEWINGIDKPVRDRMKGLVQGVKDFLPQDTLRNFSHLFSLKVGKGNLVVCTLDLSRADNPAVANFIHALKTRVGELLTDKGIAPADLRAYLARATAEGVRREDVMNHFWEIDNKPVEDTLFWEEAGLDLRKIR